MSHTCKNLWQKSSKQHQYLPFFDKYNYQFFPTENRIIFGFLLRTWLLKTGFWVCGGRQWICCYVQKMVLSSHSARVLRVLNFCSWQLVVSKWANEKGPWLFRVGDYITQLYWIFGGFKKNDGKLSNLTNKKSSNKLVQLAPRILEQVHRIFQDFWDEISWTCFKSVVEDQRSLLKMAQRFPKKKQTPGGWNVRRQLDRCSPPKKGEFLNFLD